MKPAPFEYFAPETVDEAVALLAEHGDEAKPLAGGQSLIPAMNFRLARPSVLVDLSRISSLQGIHQVNDDLVIGAMTRQRDVEKSSLVKAGAPLVHCAMPLIAHPQIRNQGTFGGSLAHADPASELPAVALALDAHLKLQGPGGERIVAAKDFFLALFETAVQPDELLTAITLPPPMPRTGAAFQELSRRHGDYALVGAAATITLGTDGKIRNARLVFMSVGEIPVDAVVATQSLVGEKVSDEVLRAAARQAASEEIDPTNDIHATAAYRRHLAEVIGFRALRQAADRVA